MMLVLEKEMTFRNKKILVVGLARSGTGAANLLSSLGARVTVTDRKSQDALYDWIKKLSPDVKVITDDNPEQAFASSDMIVLSPGVPSDIPPVVKARAKGIPVIGELELAYQIVMSDELRVVTENQGKTDAGRVSGISRFLAPSFIGVTGTNGKSTTVTLIDLMLKQSGCRTLLGGNIGNALTEEVLKALSSQQSNSSGEHCRLNVDYIVAEISSFQLETIKEFRPKVAAILNITPDHLDRYNNLNDYIEAKARIFENQTDEDYLILNADDPLTMELYNSRFKIQNSKLPRVIFFSRKKEVHGLYLKDGMIHCNFQAPELYKGISPHAHADSGLIRVDEIKIRGVHNLENAMAASLIALISGCSCKDIKTVLENFPGLEHRLEFVDEVNGVRFINDSKGTNVGAVAKSLEGLDNVILIMGGTDKGSDFSVLSDLIKRKVKLLILIGEAKGKIANALQDSAETLMADDMKGAVRLARSNASEGDTVLLSPGCASFDMFSDFEDRGRKFKEAVRDISDE